MKIGDTSILSATQARKIAQEILAEVELGEDPASRKESGGSDILLGELLEKHYFPWISQNRKAAEKTKASMRSSFKVLWKIPISDISIAKAEEILSTWKKGNNRGTTINRKMSNLKAALNWAVRYNLIQTSPLEKLSRRKENDSSTKLRYLTHTEEDRLYEALHERDRKIREARARHIQWGEERGQEIPTLTGLYADHLEPMITISLKTGVRRGTLFGLEWGDIDFNHKTLAVRPENCKTGKGQIIPLSKSAVEALEAWEGCSCRKEYAQDSPLVFPSPKTGKKLDNIKKAWETILKDAQIGNFRWHDLRHTFASRLVMAGADLNVVRELMGHATLQMTLRYAHLAPEAKARAVSLLG